MKVLITKRIPKIAEEMLIKQGICVDIPNDEGLSKEDILRHIENCDAIITMLADQIDKEFFDNAKSLKVVSNFAVGYNNIDSAYAKSLNIKVTNTPDVLTDATAELALTLLMATSRRIKESQKFIENGHWQRWETIKLLGPSLKGKTLGIYGLGRIGQAFAEKCEKALGMKIIYHNRNKKNVPYQFVDFDTLLAESDVLSIHSPLTEETRYRFKADTFARMKDTSILINTSRGEICHTEDLYDALKNRKLFAAGLDVTDPEPLPPEHKLYQLDNVLITPHIGSATIETRDAMAKLCAENVIKILKGEEAVTPIW